MSLAASELDENESAMVTIDQAKSRPQLMVYNHFNAEKKFSKRVGDTKYYMHMHFAHLLGS